MLIPSTACRKELESFEEKKRQQAQEEQRRRQKQEEEQRQQKLARKGHEQLQRAREQLQQTSIEDAALADSEVRDNDSDSPSATEASSTKSSLRPVYYKSKDLPASAYRGSGTGSSGRGSPVTAPESKEASAETPSLRQGETESSGARLHPQSQGRSESQRGKSERRRKAIPGVVHPSPDS